MSDTVGAKIHDWVLENRFVVALLLIALIALVAVALFLAYLCDLLTFAQVRIAVTGIGAFGTLSLAVFTVLSILETRKQTTERLKEQDKHIEERILSEVNSLLDTVKENEENLYDPEFDWINSVDEIGSDEPPYVDLDPLEIDHPTVAGRFEEKYEFAHEEVEAYNELISEIDRSAINIVYESSEYISEYIESVRLPDSDGTLLNTVDVLNLVLSGRKMNRRSHSEDDPDWWQAEGELRSQVQSCTDGELQEFYDKKQDLEVKSAVVADELDSVREHILDEYPIQPQS